MSATNARWLADDTLLPSGVWQEIQRRGIAAGLEGHVVTADLAEQLYPKAEYLASQKVGTETDSPQRSERLASERSAKDYPINFSRCCE